MEKNGGDAQPRDAGAAFLWSFPFYPTGGVSQTIGREIGSPWLIKGALMRFGQRIFTGGVWEEGFGRDRNLGVLPGWLFEPSETADSRPGCFPVSVSLSIIPRGWSVRSSAGKNYAIA